MPCLMMRLKKHLKNFLKTKKEQNQEVYAYLEYVEKNEHTLLGYEVGIVVAQPIDPNDLFSDSNLDWGEIEDIWRDCDSGWEFEINDIKEKHKQFEEFCNEFYVLQKQFKKLTYQCIDK